MKCLSCKGRVSHLDQLHVTHKMMSSLYVYPIATPIIESTSYSTGLHRSNVRDCIVNHRQCRRVHGSYGAVMWCASAPSFIHAIVAFVTINGRVFFIRQDRFHDLHYACRSKIKLSLGDGQKGHPCPAVCCELNLRPAQNWHYKFSTRYFFGVKSKS